MKPLATLAIALLCALACACQSTSFQDPPLGLYRTPEDLHEPGVGVYREYTQQLAMLSHGEVVRLAEEGWRLVAVTPEYEGSIVTGQRYDFEKENTGE